MSGQGAGLLGAVLAGGRARRFGRNKANAEVEGRSMLLRAVDALAPHVEDTVLVLSPDPGRDPRDLPPLPVLRDSTTGLGPLEGLRVALVRALQQEREGVVVLACDLPLVDAGVVAALIEAWKDRPAERPDGLVPLVEGVPQPLAAVYGTGVLGVVEARLAGAERSLMGLLGDLRVETLEAARPPVTTDRFLNVNTPEDREAARALLEAVRSPGVEGSRGT